MASSLDVLMKDVPVTPFIDDIEKYLKGEPQIPPKGVYTV
jgi:hypothetical protein